MSTPQRQARAAYVTAFEGPDAVQVRSTSLPAVHPGAVRIVTAVGGSTFPDVLQTRGAYRSGRIPPSSSARRSPAQSNMRLLLQDSCKANGWLPDLRSRAVAEIEPLVRDGALDPMVGATYPLEEIGTALADMEQRRALRKAMVLL